MARVGTPGSVWLRFLAHPAITTHIPAAESTQNVIDQIQRMPTIIKVNGDQPTPVSEPTDLLCCALNPDQTQEPSDDRRRGGGVLGTGLQPLPALFDLVFSAACLADRSGEPGHPIDLGPTPVVLAPTEEDPV